MIRLITLPSAPPTDPPNSFDTPSVISITIGALSLLVSIVAIAASFSIANKNRKQAKQISELETKVQRKFAYQTAYQKFYLIEIDKIQTATLEFLSTVREALLDLSASATKEALAEQFDTRHEDSEYQLTLPPPVRRTISVGAYRLLLLIDNLFEPLMHPENGDPCDLDDTSRDILQGHYFIQDTLHLATDLFALEEKFWDDKLQSAIERGDPITQKAASEILKKLANPGKSLNRTRAKLSLPSADDDIANHSIILEHVAYSVNVFLLRLRHPKYFELLNEYREDLLGKIPAVPK